MDNTEPFFSLGLALFAGLVIGFEREQAAAGGPRAVDSFLGGARTHPLVALVAGVSMLVARQVGVAVVVLAFLGLLALLVFAYVADLKRDADRGITSEVAFVLSFLLGALAASDAAVPSLRHRAFVVASVAIVATLLLSVKPALHSFVAKVSPTDLYATLKFLLISVVLLPLLPDEAMGPMNALNPQRTGLMVVLIAGISFVGYVGVRVLGERRGIGLSGLVGGFVSSTAVTLAFSGRAREQPAFLASCVTAVVLASSIMFARVLIEVGVVNSELLPALAVPLLATFGAGATVSFFLYRRSRREKPNVGEVALTNPFELGSALKFAALFTVVTLASKAAATWFGAPATYLTAVLAGATDVDAITLSLARLAGRGLEANVAVTAILLGAASNTLVKAGMAAVVGGARFGLQVGAALLAMSAAGAAGLAWLWLR